MWRAFEKLALSLAEKLFAILWMKETISGGFGSPSVHVDTQILERHAIGIEWGSIRRKDSEVLRHEVQHLPELHFTSAPFLLCSFTLRDVDHSAHKFNEVAGRAQNRMTEDVNVPDGALRMHDAVVHLPLCLLADSLLD